MNEIIGSPVRHVSPDELTPHPDNPRRGDVDAIARSIGQNKFFGAIVVQKSTGFILAGNHRNEAAKQLGFKKVPVMYVNVDDEHALRILAVDNRTSDLASYDDETLAALLQKILGTGKLEGAGYSDKDMSLILDGLTLPDYSDKNREVDPDELLADGHHTCPRCKFVFE